MRRKPAPFQAGGFFGASLLRLAPAVRGPLRIAAAAPVLSLVFVSAPGCSALPAQQAGGYAAEIAKIEIAEKRMTLKASMGQLTVRVAPGVALQAFKPGDKVLVTFGQEGAEPIVTRIELGQR
jgi:Cu/Ag efflux protein CusF